MWFTCVGVAFWICSAQSNCTRHRLVLPSFNVCTCSVFQINSNCVNYLRKYSKYIIQGLHSQSKDCYSNLQPRFVQDDPLIFLIHSLHITHTYICVCVCLIENIKVLVKLNWCNQDLYLCLFCFLQNLKLQKQRREQFSSGPVSTTFTPSQMMNGDSKCLKVF